VEKIFKLVRSQWFKEINQAENTACLVGKGFVCNEENK